MNHSDEYEYAQKKLKVIFRCLLFTIYIELIEIMFVHSIKYCGRIEKKKRIYIKAYQPESEFKETKEH